MSANGRCTFICGHFVKAENERKQALFRLYFYLLLTVGQLSPF